MRVWGSQAEAHRRPSSEPVARTLQELEHDRMVTLINHRDGSSLAPDDSGAGTQLKEGHPIEGARLMVGELDEQRLYQDLDILVGERSSRLDRAKDDSFSVEDCSALSAGDLRLPIIR
jgi:hypothetical protein